MVFFNNPVPIPDPAARAVKMTMAMREAAGKLIAGWRRRSLTAPLDGGFDEPLRAKIDQINVGGEALRRSSGRGRRCSC
jgi:hypothetical protein